jgi:hypothetical protein
LKPPFGGESKDREAVYTVLPFFSFIVIAINGLSDSMRSISILLTVGGLVLALPAAAQSLQQIAKQQGCTSAPVVVDGTDLYKCQTESAMSFFNVPSAGNGAATSAPARKGNGGSAARAPTPANFPRVDNSTQRDRDDVRKRVLTEELATEVRMMVESELMLKQGSVPQAGETVTSPKYIDRVAKLKQTVDNHSKNIQALNKELERVR